MQRLLAIIKNDWRLLLHDKIGLLILFVLPMCLVIFISVTQSSLFDDKSTIKILLINLDKGSTGKAIQKALVKKSQFKITIAKTKSIDAAKNSISTGKYQALLVLPTDLSRIVKNNLNASSHRTISTKHIMLYLDPIIAPNIASTLKLSLNYLFQTVQLEATQKMLSSITRVLKYSGGPAWFDVTQHYVSLGGNVVRPNSVQQNVPAWTLFGMFFIVVPLASFMVQERSQGVIQRLRVSPVYQSTFLIGRSIAYVVLNLIQLSMMLMIGVWVLPFFNLPELAVSGHLGAIYLVGVFAALAATGFGIFMGTWITSRQQATTVGPFIVVIAAAISGIFVPVYVMPSAFNIISQFSPLHWAQTAFLDIFVRHADVVQVLDSIGKLFAFFVLMILLSVPPVTRLRSHRKIH